MSCFHSLFTRYNATCTINSTLECPLNYASGVGAAFGRIGVPLSDESCSADTLEQIYWQVEVGTEALLLLLFFFCEIHRSTLVVFWWWEKRAGGGGRWWW